MRLDSNLTGQARTPLQVVRYVPVQPVAAVGRAQEDAHEVSGQERSRDLAGADQLELSASALARAAEAQAGPKAESKVEAQPEEAPAGAGDPESEAEGGAPEPLTGPRGADGEALAPEEQQQLAELQARDREVRAHEQAHKAAAGQLATGGPTYETQTGPDGREYAIGGEVQIQLKDGSTPEETIRLAQQARRAALAPAEPSAQDHAVAAEATQREAAARAEAYQESAQAPRDGAPTSLGQVFA